MKLRTVTILIPLLIISLGVVVWWQYDKAAFFASLEQPSGETSNELEPAPPNDDPKVVDVPPTPSNVPTGWKTYQNQHLSVAFAYPPTWTLQEHLKQDGTFGYVTVTGDGYQVTVFELTHGFEQDGVTYTTPEYFVAGQRAKAWYAEIGQGFRLIIGLPNCKYPRPTFFTENISSTSKEIIDQILTTVACN